METQNIVSETLPITEILERILSVCSPEKIILFGSQAYGTPRRDSDIDILVVKPLTASRVFEYRVIRKSLRGLGYAFDIIVLSPQEFEYYSKNWLNSAVSEAREKGIVVYEKYQ